MDVNEVNEDNINPYLFRLCESDPDLALSIIEESIKKDPSIESEPVYRFCRARAYQIKGTLCLRDKPWVKVGTANPDEIRLYVNDDDLNCLELSLLENGNVENDDPSILKIFGEEWENQIDAISCILERCRPGRVQQIRGKTKLNYFGVDRNRILPDIEKELPPEQLRHFLNILFSYSTIVKSAVIIETDTDTSDREYIYSMLFGKTFDEFAPGETFEDAQIGSIYIFDDGTFIDSVERERKYSGREIKGDENMNVKVIQILETLRYGSVNDKLKSIALVRRRVDESLLGLFLEEREVKQLVKEVSVTEPFSKAELEEIQSGLRDVLASRKDILVCWYAIIALVDSGDLSKECLENLLSASTQVISWLVEIGKEDGGALTGAVMEFSVQKETVRALSQFKNSQEAAEMIKECFEGRLLLGRQETGGLQVLRKSALFAFGALGNSNYRSLVEYLATQSENNKETEAAKAALALWGQGHYDDIEREAEGVNSKFKPSVKAILKQKRRFQNKEETAVAPGNATSDVRCPICGSETTLRTAKQGPNVGSKFHVCTRYPECKGKIAIE